MEGIDEGPIKIAVLRVDGDLSWVRPAAHALRQLSSKTSMTGPTSPMAHLASS